GVSKQCEVVIGELGDESPYEPLLLEMRLATDVIGHVVPRGHLHSRLLPQQGQERRAWNGEIAIGCLDVKLGIVLSVNCLAALYGSSPMIAKPTIDLFRGHDI